MGKLIDSCINITDGEHNTVSKESGTGYFLLANENIVNGGVEFSSIDREIGKEDFDRIYRRCKIEVGDVLISTVGELGKLAIVEDYKSNYVFQRSVGLIKPSKLKLNSYYLYYLLSTSYAQKKLKYSSYGSMQKGLTLDTLKNFDLDLPSLEEQLKISKPLRLIDEQIKRNNVLVQKLQVLAQAIYRRWFLQFNYPNFNKNMLYSNELKTKIPDDWSVLTLGDLVVKIALISNKNNKNTIDLSVMPSSNISLGKLNSCDNFSTNLNKMFEGNILFGSIRPYLKKCGIAPCDGNVVGTIYQFKEVRQNSYNYALITMSQDFFFDYALKVSKGTRMPVVSCDDLLSYKMPYNKKIVDLYSKLPIKRLIVAVNKETNKLSALKEELIPLLINGQLV